MELKELSAAQYARDVLPLTAELWAGRRDLETYTAQTLAQASSGYGKRHVRFIALVDGRTVLSSFKSYERSIDFGNRRLNGCGIGAVYTEPALRGRGYASAMISMHLDERRRTGYDAAYLFSDIRPEFYADIGFCALPSRALSLRADGLPASRVQVSRADDAQWPGIQRCFEVRERSREWRFVRTPLVWQWIKLRVSQSSGRDGATQTNLVVRRGRAIAAYVFGVRAPLEDAYVLEEYGFCDAEAAALIPPLLRNAAGDLRRIVGWLPPDGARELLPRGSVKRRSRAIFMAAPLSQHGRAWCDVALAARPSDGVWSTDHI